VTITILYPHFEHAAIEERYASRQTRLRLGADRRPLELHRLDAPASTVAAEISSEHSLVVTDPLLVPGGDVAVGLVEALTPDVAAALPVTNVAEHPQQRCSPDPPYLTLRELELFARERSEAAPERTRLVWEASDPGLYLCETRLLRDTQASLRRVLAGRQVIVSHNDYVHRFDPLRGQTRADLLARIPETAKAILDLGCGEGALGAALKKRQNCRVVGVDIDASAIALARECIDAAHCGDVRRVAPILGETFDVIVGGDVIEHLDEPWSFLADLRRLCRPDAILLLSLPNVANASIVSDLLHGRFDYVYSGLLCAGHLRFFTRRTIEDMLALAGWSVIDIEPQPEFASTGATDLLRMLAATGQADLAEHVRPPGFYVKAHPLP
jgi:2-polyprenyl-3-methyl-5-hydroxy-6-metoxy-1,4-benzoquinol methylase